ncbi:hypothetical protein FB107DRAFT_280816 [Schizophyllum commune]
MQRVSSKLSLPVSPRTSHWPSHPPRLHTSRSIAAPSSRASARSASLSSIVLSLLRVSHLPLWRPPRPRMPIPLVQARVLLENASSARSSLSVAVLGALAASLLKPVDQPSISSQPQLDLTPFHLPLPISTFPPILLASHAQGAVIFTCHRHAINAAYT